MNRKWGALALAAVAAMLLVAYGCGSKQKAVKNDPNTAQTGGGQTPENPENPNTPGGKELEDYLTGEPIDITKPVVIPEPGTRGWEKADSLDPQGLAARMDEAMRGLENAFGQVRMSYDYQGAQLNGVAELRFDRKGKYRVEYYLPETETDRYIVVGDGSEKAMLVEGGWQTLGKVGDKGAAKSGDAKTAQKWATDFMGEMLSYHRDGADAWKPIITAWTKNPDRFAVTMEEGKRKLKDTTGNLVDRPFYRLVIKSKTNKDTMEVIVDGKRYLPLTVKSVLNEGQDQLFWNAQWAFKGGEHDQKLFTIPEGI